MEMSYLNATQMNRDVTVREGMRNSVLGLSFVYVPPPPKVNQQQLEKQRMRVERRDARLENQGPCCWRIETIQGLRYRIIADLLCAATLLPGSITVIMLSIGYINSQPSPSEPYPWLKYIVAVLGCLLLILYLAWLATAFCVYRKAAKRERADRCAHATNGSCAFDSVDNPNAEDSGSTSDSDDIEHNLIAEDVTPEAPIDIVVVPPTAERLTADTATEQA